MRLMCVNNNLPRRSQGKQLSKYAYNKLQNERESRRVWESEMANGCISVGGRKIFTK